MTKELRVYAIDSDQILDTEIDKLTNLDFIDLAEQTGTVFSLGGFQKAYNKQEIPSSFIIRFILIDSYTSNLKKSWVEYLAK